MNYPWLNEARRQFDQRRQGERMAHAFLLTGPKALGKQQLAMQLAASLLCQTDTETACGHCRSCTLLQGGAHPDFRYLSFEVNPRTDVMRTGIVIEQVRNLISSMQLTNSVSERKVAVIYPAEAMNRSAANALLKTLEEPPGDAFLILVSHHSARLPATIRSRCQSVDVRLPERAVSLEWLVQQSSADMQRAEMALKAAAGSPLTALALLNGEGVEQFQSVISTLATLQQDDSQLGVSLDKLAGLEPADLWNWLSLIAAEHLRHSLGVGSQASSAPSGEPAVLHAAAGLARQYADLQLAADQNQRLLPTPVRKDLLIRDWLIQWSQAG